MSAPPALGKPPGGVGEELAPPSCASLSLSLSLSEDRLGFGREPEPFWCRPDPSFEFPPCWPWPAMVERSELPPAPENICRPTGTEPPSTTTAAAAATRIRRLRTRRAGTACRSRSSAPPEGSSPPTAPRSRSRSTSSSPAGSEARVLTRASLATAGSALAGSAVVSSAAVGSDLAGSAPVGSAVAGSVPPASAPAAGSAPPGSEPADAAVPAVPALPGSSAVPGLPRRSSIRASGPPEADPPDRPGSAWASSSFVLRSSFMLAQPPSPPAARQCPAIRTP